MFKILKRNQLQHSFDEKAFARLFGEKKKKKRNSWNALAFNRIECGSMKPTRGVPAGRMILTIISIVCNQQHASNGCKTVSLKQNLHFFASKLKNHSKIWELFSFNSTELQLSLTSIVDQLEIQNGRSHHRLNDFFVPVRNMCNVYIPSHHIHSLTHRAFSLISFFFFYLFVAWFHTSHRFFGIFFSFFISFEFFLCTTLRRSSL